LLFLKRFYNKLFPKDREFVNKLSHLVGFVPANESIYKQAFLHSSLSGDVTMNNERLEYLGDAILDSVISEVLFSRFPKKPEGFLTETRAKIVSRKKLGRIARAIGIQELLSHNNIVITGSSSILGNALEALIGAIYLDAGFKAARNFVIKKMIVPHIDLSKIANTELNYKSRIVEWSQKNNALIKFRIISEQDFKTHRIFKTELSVNEKHISIGEGPNKKSAENAACRLAIEKLKITDN